MAFPDLTPGQDIGTPHTEGQITWIWDGEKWSKASASLPDTIQTSKVITESEIQNQLIGHVSRIISDYDTISNQKEANSWISESVKRFDEVYSQTGEFLGGITFGTTEPDEYDIGTLWYITSPLEEKGLYIYNGADWIRTQEFEQSPAVILRDSVPDVDFYDEGTIWINEDTYDYYVLATGDAGKTWVQLNADQGPAPATLTMSDTPPDIASNDDGQLWCNTNNMDLFVLFEGAWIKLNASLAK